MATRFVLPLLSVLGLALAVFTVVQARQPTAVAQPREQPPARPSEIPAAGRVIAGSGVVEPRRENIPIGTPVAGIVAEVLVKEGDDVAAGQALFRIDARELEAQLTVAQAQATGAGAELERLRNDPSELDLPPAIAGVKEAGARLEDARIVRDRFEQLYRRDAGTASEYDSARTKHAAEEAALGKAEAELARARVKAATYDEQILISQARLAEAEAVVRQTEVEIERRTIRALVDGVVLQLNVRPGQYAAMIWNEPLAVLGDLGRLHVRVDIDEQDLPWFNPEGRAIATLRGRPSVKFALTPVRIKPYVVPKQSLTGDNSERVDTRVLQVIYALPEDELGSLYIGQQMDVYVGAETKQAAE